MIIRIILV